MTTKTDYIRSDELADAVVPVAWLTGLFKVSESTIRRWLRADGIATFPHPTEETRPGMPDLAVRWGDIPTGHHRTRWNRRNA
ncbi:MULTISPECIES: hypothetical protein [unclassified Microbacterium]|uniref:hypothetical protein n=1 Tax=unclassified Microbacterium TaxID=2609290 RepID=UPI00109C5636|nr:MULTISPECIES: hypothetical protein [unclassified Microbacterium]